MFRHVVVVVVSGRRGGNAHGGYMSVRGLRGVLNARDAGRSMGIAPGNLNPHARGSSLRVMDGNIQNESQGIHLTRGKATRRPGPLPHVVRRLYPFVREHEMPQIQLEANFAW